MYFSYLGSRDGNIILWDTRVEQNSFIGRPDCTIVNSHAGKETNTPSKNRKKYNMMTNSGLHKLYIFHLSQLK